VAKRVFSATTIILVHSFIESGRIHKLTHNINKKARKTTQSETKQIYIRIKVVVVATAAAPAFCRAVATINPNHRRQKTQLTRNKCCPNKFYKHFTQTTYKLKVIIAYTCQFLKIKENVFTSLCSKQLDTQQKNIYFKSRNLLFTTKDS
jgi:hypothetical protein